MQLALNETDSSVYLSVSNVQCHNFKSMSLLMLLKQSSPPQFCPDGRTGDLEAILHTMDQAQKYINIAVMDYIPAMLYTPHHQ